MSITYNSYQPSNSIGGRKGGREGRGGGGWWRRRGGEGGRDIVL